MKIGLIDVDGHSGFLNLALMRLSAYHKARGDEVEWCTPRSGSGCNGRYAVRAAVQGL